MKGAAIAILAGGASRRMGRDKASLLLDGETLLHRTARIAVLAAQSQAEGHEVCVIGRQRPPLWDLPSVGFVPDARPGLGPLGGLLTALSYASAVLLIACDMPALTPEAISWLLARSREHAAETGVGVRAQGSFEPLFSSYHASCLPIAEDRAGRGELSLQGLIRAGGFTIVDAPEEIAGLLLNVNTEKDLASFRERHSGG